MKKQENQIDRINRLKKGDIDMNKGEPMINIIEIRDNGLFIDGTKIKAYNNYGLSRASDEGYSRLVLDIPVIIKGLDDWQLDS